MPELGRSYGEGIGDLLQYSCLGNPMGREEWRATVHGVTKELDVTQRLNNSNGINGLSDFSQLADLPQLCDFVQLTEFL